MFKSDKWFNGVYALIGIVIALLVVLQLMFSSISELYEHKQILNSTKFTDKDTKLGPVNVQDMYKQQIEMYPTYVKLADAVVAIVGNKDNIMVPKIKPNIADPSSGMDEETSEPEYSIDSTLVNASQSTEAPFKGVKLGLPLDKYSYTLGSRFGDVKTSGTGYKEINLGLHLETEGGEQNVYSCLSGVVKAVENVNTNEGLKVIVENTETKLTIVYGSLKMSKVIAGDTVEMGTIIGVTGNTTYNTNSHLYLEIFDTETGTRFDPEKFSYLR